MTKRVKVLMYSATLHIWEVWCEGRPEYRGSLDQCLRAYPNGPAPSRIQCRIADNDSARRASD